MPDVVPFDESLMPAEMPGALADIQLDDRHLQYAATRWPDASESMRRYRVRQAIWAKFKHAQPHPDDPSRRLLGGAQPGSGPKPKLRLGAALVEAAQERQREVIDAAMSALRPGVDPAVRHKAAMNLAKHEQNERSLEIVEDDYARRTDADIKKDFASRLATMIRDGELSMDDINSLAAEKAGIADAEVVQPERLSA